MVICDGSLFRLNCYQFEVLHLNVVKNITSKKLKGLPSKKIAELPEETVTDTEEPMMEAEENS